MLGVGVVEQASNFMLFAHLRDVSRRFDDARTTRLLSWGAWLVVLACAGGAVISLVRWQQYDRPVVTWRFVQAFYGAFALGAGMVMSLGVLRLLALVVAASVDRSAVSFVGRSARSRSTRAYVGRSVRLVVSTARDRRAALGRRVPTVARQRWELVRKTYL